MIVLGDLIVVIVAGRSAGACIVVGLAEKDVPEFFNEYANLVSDVFLNET